MDNSQYEQQTSGIRRPYWLQQNHSGKFSAITTGQITDVVIIGAGISGLTTAYLLLKSGHEVIVIDDGEPGSGETGRTTAHLSNALDDRYFELQRIFNKDKARLAAESHTAAIDRIQQIVNEENIDCAFRRLPGYLFLHPNDKPENLEKEFEAALDAGVSVQLKEQTPGIFHVTKSIEFAHQAQFHIMDYIAGLCHAITKMGGRIFTYTHADQIAEGSIRANGFEITANHVVVATNSPVNDVVTMHTKQTPYRTYVIAGLIPKGSVPYALWWDSGDEDSKWVAKPYHYVRLTEYDNQYDLLISGGEDHKTGQAESEDILEEDRYAKLEKWTRNHFPMLGDILWQWSGQVMEPVDCLGYLGRNPGDKNVYIITGDSGNGMTHGTIGAIIINDLINNVENPWADLYDPARVTLNTAIDYAIENAKVIAQYGDWLSVQDKGKPDDLNLNSGGVFASGMNKAAVYRDSGGQFHFFSAVCPHLGCAVKWNDDEKSFDCPCHGSRFSCYGNVMNGPSLTDLKSLSIRK